MPSHFEAPVEFFQNAPNVLEEYKDLVRRLCQAAASISTTKIIVTWVLLSKLVYNACIKFRYIGVWSTGPLKTGISTLQWSTSFLAADKLQHTSSVEADDRPWVFPHSWNCRNDLGSFSTVSIIEPPTRTNINRLKRDRFGKRWSL